MSYRSDHDAAIARVDILERELEQMAGEYEKVREIADRSATPPRTSWAARLAGMGLAVFAIGAMVAGIVVSQSRDETPASAGVEPPVPVAPTVVALPTDLATCLDDVIASTALAADLDASSTDPRGNERRSVADIARIGAACRPELVRARTNGELDSATRAVLADWSQREDELVGATSRLLVYYSSDPYVINNYATAGQVWRELDAARSSRDTLIASKGPALRSAIGGM